MKVTLFFFLGSLVTGTDGTFGCLLDTCEHICDSKLIGYECRCRSGYIVDPLDRKKCIPATPPKVTCDRGFEPSAYNPKTCVDIDECRDEINIRCQHKCTNTIGSYQCSCRSGYVVSRTDSSKCEAISSSCPEGQEPSPSNARVCVDIDECRDEMNLRCQHKCTNTVGSYLCSCRSGYVVSRTDPSKCEIVNICGEGFLPSQADPSKCEDIDECNRSGGSPCEHICTNTPGSYQCSCRRGYKVTSCDSNKCEDVDECLNNPCEQVCTNNAGSYICSCRDGYDVSSSDPTKCQVANFCKSNPCQHTCTTTNTGFQCSCRKGYAVSKSDTTRCEDIDECIQSGGSPCEQVCTNTAGSYQCSCRRGYKVSSSNANKCEDVDECSSSNPCEQICTNTAGSYTCSCREGYAVDASDSTKCQATNYCKSNPCQQTCTSTATGFQCSCKKGYTVSKSDPTKCQDVDECSSSNPCEQICTNTAGSYTCSCREGFAVDASNSTRCQATNYCASNPCEQICTSTNTGFQCSCKKGYTISKTDPKKCEDINECSSNPCQQTCTNTKGSFKCSCGAGLVVNPADKTKCTADECSKGRPCEHICTVIPGGRKCSCRDGFVINDEDNTLCDEMEICKVKADIILVFDASSSILEENYDKQFIFAKKLTKNFNVGPNDVEFGAVVFSRYTEILFNLKDHSSHVSIDKALTNVTYMNSSTYTHEAFKLIDEKQLFSTANGGRSNVPDIVVLFTDGNPTFNDKAITAAQVLKDKGVLIIGVGIGHDLDMAILKQLSSTPEDALEASSYDTLDYIEKRLTALLCQVSASL